MEARLYRLLLKARPEERRTLLVANFSQHQRLALERWILAQQGDLCATMAECKTARQLPAGKKSQRPASRSGLVGVQSRIKSGRLLYRASVIVGPFRLISGYSAKLDKARAHLEVLLRIRRRVCGAKFNGEDASDGGNALMLDTPAQELASRLRDALSQEVPASFKHECARSRSCLDSSQEQYSNGELERPCIYFSASVPAGLWIGKCLSTPCFPVAGGLEAGLRAWQHLRRARGLVFTGRCNRYSILQRHSPEELEAAWVGLRQAYVDVWSEASRQCPLNVASRLSALERGHRRCWHHALCHPQRPIPLARAGSGGMAHAGLPRSTAARQVIVLLERWARQKTGSARCRSHHVSPTKSQPELNKVIKSIIKTGSQCKYGKRTLTRAKTC